MPTLTLDPNLLMMSPVYAVMFTGVLVSFFALRVQVLLRRAAGASAYTPVRVLAGSRLGSAFILLALTFVLMYTELMVLLPLTGGQLG